MEKLQTTVDTEILKSRLASLVDAGRPACCSAIAGGRARLAPPSPELAEISRTSGTG